MGQIILDVTKNQKPRSSLKSKVVGDAGMVPDRGFTKQLKALDKELEVVWDWGVEKWEIWKIPKDKPGYMVTRIQTQGKDYRELGQDLLLNLQMHIQIGPEKILDYLEEHNNQIRRRRAEEFEAKVRDMAIDAWGPLFTISTQVPKEYLIESPKVQKVMEVV